MVNDAFVPGHCVLPMQDMRDVCTPGRTFHDTANYRIPLRSILSFTLASPVLGMAQGTVENFECAREGSEVSSLHIRLAESAVEVDAARSLMQADTQEIFARAERDEMPTVDDRVRYRRDQVYVSRLAIRAVDRLFEADGGHSLFSEQALQRLHRDIHAAAHHVSLAWDGVAEQYGRVYLGLAPTGVDL